MNLCKKMGFVRVFGHLYKLIQAELKIFQLKLWLKLARLGLITRLLAISTEIEVLEKNIFMYFELYPPKNLFFCSVMKLP